MRPEPVEGPPSAAVPVIGLAHGSRHARGTEAIERLMAAVGTAGHPARHAFLDLAAPDLSTVATELQVADILGTGDDVAALLLAALADAGVDPETSVLLYAVGSSNSAANMAVVELAAGLERRRSAPLKAAFATCAPRPAEVLDQLPEPVAILPLFLADGLLLDPARSLAASHGWTMVEPLGERAAPLVLERYRSVRP